MRGQVRLLVAVVLAATLAACGSNADPTPTSTEPLVPSGSVVESSGVPASSPAGPTPSVLEPSTFASTSAGGYTVAPLPADLTPEEIAAANAALEVYRQYWALFDKSGAEPSANWSAEIAELATGSAIDGFVQGTASLAQDGLHAVGTTSIEVRVTKVEPALVHLASCIDTSETDLVDSSGRSFLAPDQSGSYLRYVSNSQIGQVEGGLWKLVVEQGDRAATC